MRDFLEWTFVMAAIAVMAWAVGWGLPPLESDGRCSGAGLIRNGAAWCDDQAAHARSRERAERHRRECVEAYDAGDLGWVARNCD